MSVKHLVVITLLASAVAFGGCNCSKKDKRTEAPAAPVAPTPAGVTGPVAIPTPTPTPTPVPVPDPVATPTPTPTPGPGAISDAAFEAMMNEGIAMYVVIAKAAEWTGGDCDKLARSIEQVLTDNRDLLARAKVLNADPAMAKRMEAWNQAHTSDIIGPSTTITGAAMKCTDNAAMKAAMTKLGGNGG